MAVGPSYGSGAGANSNQFSAILPPSGSNQSTMGTEQRSPFMPQRQLPFGGAPIMGGPFMPIPGASGPAGTGGYDYSGYGGGPTPYPGSNQQLPFPMPQNYYPNQPSSLTGLLNAYGPYGNYPNPVWQGSNLGGMPGFGVPGGAGSASSQWMNPRSTGDPVRGSTGIGQGWNSVNPLDPNLTMDYTTWLGQQIGQGLTPFNLPTNLATGGQTQPGQLNAPLNPLFSQLGSFMSGGPTSMPGLNTLGTVANQGISTLPTWNAMTDAMQRQIQEGQANLKEQFNVGSGLAGSPFGTAMTDYQTQSNKDLNSLLGQLQFQGIGEQLGAASGLAGLGANLGQQFQQINQQDIQNIYNEFLRTQPQYNPMLPYEAGMATTFPPIFQQGGKGGGVLGGLLGGIGNLAGGAMAGLGAAGGGSGLMGSILTGLAAL